MFYPPSIFKRFPGLRVRAESSCLLLMYQKRAMSQPGQKHVCFFSKHCRWSEAFIKELKQTPYVQEVHFICVDRGPDGKRPPLPQWLKQTPTLIVRGEEEPRVDGDVMNWLSERRLMGQGQGQGQGDSQGSGAQEPEPWVVGEMGGSLTKSYSLLAGEGEDAPVGNFSYLHGANAVSTRTASDMPGGGLGARGQDKSRKEKLFDKQYENFLRDRDMGMPPPVMRQ